jgi:ABC-2 type transport system permease protein
MFTAPAAVLSLTVFLALFGPLASLVLGFDSINRERNQGTLSKILSQPIYRDEVILGKYLAGLLTISIMLTALLLLLAGLGLVGIGVVPSPEEVFRLAVFGILTVVYLGFWLGLSILLSIFFRSVATSAMAAAALWLFLVFFLPILAQAASVALVPMEDPQRPRVEELQAVARLQTAATLLSPAGLYDQASQIIMDPTHRGKDQALRLASMSRLDQFLLNRFQGGLSAGQSLILMMPDFFLLVCFSVIVFLFSYLAFVRQEIRSA